jgi:serine/threonine protein kinase
MLDVPLENDHDKLIASVYF